LHDEVLGQGEFDYQFVEDEVKELYNDDKRTTRIYVTFAGLAICVSCLGLLGLSLYDIRQRYREIALRKVNGATGKQIALLLVRKYLYILGAAFAVAIPLAYYIIQDYTKDFAVKAPIGIELFIAGFILTLVISLGTLLWQVCKAVRINPALIMKNE
jgi:ABC-type antimicrobial peptide transport system permease subunit